MSSAEPFLEWYRASYCAGHDHGEAGLRLCLLRTLAQLEAEIPRARIKGGSV